MSTDSEIIAFQEGRIAELEAQLSEAKKGTDRLRRLVEMGASPMSEHRVCYYLRNMRELDLLIKLDKIAK